MACASFKLKQAYDWYKEMDNEMTYSWWCFGGGLLGVFHGALLIPYVGAIALRSSDIVNFLLILLTTFATIGPAVFMDLAIKYSPNYHTRKVQKLYKLGCLPKSLAEVAILCIAIALRSAFEDIFACLAWILFALQLQFIWQMWYPTRDLNLPDLLCVVLLQLFMVYQKRNDPYDFKAMCVFCVLVIYQKNWSTPSCTTIFSESECLCEEKPITQNVTESKP